MTSIRFRRGAKAVLPTAAPSGMPLWCEDTKELHVGTGAGTFLINNLANLNAVTLEGLSASAFALVDHTHINEFQQSFGSNGYTKFPNGLIIQWGRVINSLARGGTYTVYLPTTFTNALWQVHATVIAASPNNGTLALQTLNYFTNRFSIQVIDADSNLTDFVWFAVGY